MSDRLKIYTKGGDTGETSLLGGSRVPKYHERIEAYGTLDELNSFIGLLRDQPMESHYKEKLLRIQEIVFVAESRLAADKQENQNQLPLISEEDILDLENEIDKMNVGLPELKSFILPGGHPTVSYCHVSRTVCRRAERLVIRLKLTNHVDGLIIKYLNRLSDYFFVLGRRLSLDLNAEEILWKAWKNR